SDADGDALQVAGLRVVEGGGTIEDLGDGRYAYRPAPDASGRVVLAYTVTDGHGGSVAQTARFDVSAVNDPPVIRPDATQAAATVAELPYGASGAGTAVHTRSGTIAFADPDAGDGHSALLKADGAGYLGTLTLGPVDPVSRTLTWTFTVPDRALDGLAAGETRVQTYSVLISDGQGGTAAQPITVTLTGAGERPPIAHDDPDLHPSLLTNSSFSAAPDFSGWNTVTTPSNNFTDNSYEAHVFVDRTGTRLAGADAVAVLNFDGRIDTAGGTAWGPSIRSATFSAAAGDAVKFDWILSSGSDWALGRGYLRDSTGHIVDTVFEFNTGFSGTTGLRTSTFILPTSGSYYIDFQVGSYDSTFGRLVGAELVIDYAGVVPRIREDVPLVIHLAELLANDSDPGGLPIHLVSVAPTSEHGGTVTLNTDGTITYDPRAVFDHLAQGQTASDSFVYTIANTSGATASATASFTVAGVNDAPTGGLDHILAASGAGLSVPKSALLFNDRDPDAGAHLRVADVTDAGVSEGGDAIIVNGAGNGGHFSYVVEDEFGARSAQTVQAVVNRADALDLVGAPNDEILIAAGSTQVLTGGGGHDVFVFADPTTVSTITDFEPGAAGDAIDLTGLLGSDVTAETLGAHARMADVDGYLALQVHTGPDGSWHTLAHLNLPVTTPDVTVIWTDHLVRLSVQAPLV
ncbi:tandem-95 repeat protein, partial [Methylobacterium segetis]|uniref:tandem-95 repeat protein n=1 Tax=Methylobacterium segetis TaxID=2488750 RepID=UPI00104EEA79